MFDSQLSELKSQSGKLRRFALLQNAIYWVEKTAIEALIGLLVAVVLHWLCGDFIPRLLTSHFDTFSGALKIEVLFDADKMKAIFSIRNCWAVVFGIRFVINYLVHGFDGFVSSK